MNRHIVWALLALIALTGCASSGQGQAGSDLSNQRGGFFSSYTGNHGTASSRTTIKGTTPDGPVDLQIESSAPFVINFGDIEANTENATTGQSADAATNSTETKPSTDLNLTKTR